MHIHSFACGIRNFTDLSTPLYYDIIDVGKTTCENHKIMIFIPMIV